MQGAMHWAMLWAMQGAMKGAGIPRECRARPSKPKAGNVRPGQLPGKDTGPCGSHAPQIVLLSARTGLEHADAELGRNRTQVGTRTGVHGPASE